MIRTTLSGVVGGGRISVVISRDPCPVRHRPCGVDCPYTELAEVAREQFAPESARLRHLGELTYCDGLLQGVVEYRHMGLPFEVGLEIAGESGDGAQLVEALRVEVGSHVRRFPASTLAASSAASCRSRDVERYLRLPPGYSAAVTWVPTVARGNRRTRVTRPPTQFAGRWVTREGFSPTPRLRIPLDGVAHGAERDASSTPLVKVIWEDLRGLQAARGAAARTPDREIAFILCGRLCFCTRTRTAFTEVQRVHPVEQYDVSHRTRVAIAPESYAAARRSALVDGLQIVGLLHSHVLETEEEGSRSDGLFYSTVDSEDHQRFLPSAWSIGGVLNVRADRHVELAIFARNRAGEFAALEEMWTT